MKKYHVIPTKSRLKSGRVEESRSLSANLLAFARDPSTSLGMTVILK